MVRQERSERTRHTLVMAASAVFDQYGYERATLSAISERAKVTKGALSFHFAAKADLARAVQGGACAVSGSTLANVARRDAPGFDVAASMAHALVRLIETDALVRAGARLTQEIRTPDDPALHVHLNWLSALHGALRRAKEDGSLRPDVDVPVAASLLLSLVTGTTTLPYEVPRPTAPSSRITGATTMPYPDTDATSMPVPPQTTGGNRSARQGEGRASGADRPADGTAHARGSAEGWHTLRAADADAQARGGTGGTSHAYRDADGTSHARRNADGTSHAHGHAGAAPVPRRATGARDLPRPSGDVRPRPGYGTSPAAHASAAERLTSALHLIRPALRTP
ncbi:TetR family transcriptional regulator [Streptomyces sp. NPDC048566]|uniref:TetR family transcriptional regulator n=1 Tax=Streptomyces sp. NPDC048566 TaxID=3365569 RepID=UPI00371E2F04